MKLHKPITFVCSYKMYPNMEAELRNFAEMLGDTFNFHLIVGKNQCPDYLKKYFKVFEYSKPLFDVKGFGFGISSCYEYLKKENPSIIINIGRPFTVGISMLSVSLFFNCKTVLRIEGDVFSDYKMYNNKYKTAKTFILHNVIATNIYKMADKIIVLGENMKRKAIENGIAKEDIFILPQPFDTTFFEKKNKTQDELKSILGLSRKAKVVLYIGRDSHIKGSDILKEIIDGLETETHIQFCLIGCGLKKCFKDYREPKVKVVESIPHSKIADYFQAADMLIQTSRREGLPNIILEALASKLPVVATPVGENEHYISHIATEVKDFIAYIKASDLEPDPVPEWFNWKIQKKKNENFFKCIANG